MKKILFIAVLCSAFVACKTQIEEVKLFTVTSDNKQLAKANGVLYYNQTPFNGTVKSFDDVNQTKNETSYKNGRKDGVEKKWYTNDAVAEIRFYKEGLKVGIHKSWFQSGQQKFEYPYSDNGRYHGTIKEWYSNGQMVREFNYTKGKESGTQRMWLSNGNIRANYTVVDGERFGLIGLKKCYTVKTNESN